jgi:GT2 family glycosyltransferase
LPKYSIIIPVYNRASLTLQCLYSLLGGAPAGGKTADCEIIVVDDASTDLTPRFLTNYDGRIRVLTHEVNSGFAMACNDGAAISSGEYLVFLNNDTIPHESWLSALGAYSVQHTKAAVVGSKLLFPNGSVQHAGVVICQDLIPRHIYNGFPGDHPAVNKSRRFQAVTGACCLIRREAFERVGGFDSSFTNGFEDVDLCLRLAEEGLEVHYCHESVLVHFETVTRDALGTQEAQNSRLFLSRWGQRLVPDDFDYYLADGLLKATYRAMYPMQIEISPLLALVDGLESEGQAEELLNIRSQQVSEFLKENIRLTVQLQEALLRRQ